MYINFWKRLFNFNGDGSSKEFWAPLIINIILSLIFIVICPAELLGIVFVFDVFVLIGTISSASRLLVHNCRSRLNFLWLALPILGWLIFIMALFGNTDPGKDIKW